MSTLLDADTRKAYFAYGAPLFAQLAAALRNGLPLHEVTSVLAQDKQLPPVARRVLSNLTQSLAQGSSLSAAMGQSPLVFPAATVDWVRRAELTNQLADTLDALAQDAERERLGRGELRMALLWPATLAAVVLVVLSVVAIFVMPAFRDAYAGMGAELPPVSNKVFVGVQLLVDYWWVAVPLLAALVVCYVKRLLPNAVLHGVDASLYTIGFVRRVAVARFMARLVGLLHGAGCDTHLQQAALTHLAATTSPRALCELGARLQAAVASGTCLSQALEAENTLPQRAALMVRLGEKMQDLRAPLAQLGPEVDAEHRAALAGFERSTILAVYLALGVVIGQLLIATYLPIFKLGQII